MSRQYRSLGHKAWARVLVGVAIVIPVRLILMGLRDLRGKAERASQLRQYFLTSVP